MLTSFSTLRTLRIFRIFSSGYSVDLRREISVQFQVLYLYRLLLAPLAVLLSCDTLDIPK